MIQLNFSGETVIHASVAFDATEAVLPVVTPEPYPQTFKFAAREVDGGIQFGPFEATNLVRVYNSDGTYTEYPSGDNLYILNATTAHYNFNGSRNLTFEKKFATLPGRTYTSTFRNASNINFAGGFEMADGIGFDSAFADSDLDVLRGDVSIYLSEATDLRQTFSAAKGLTKLTLNAPKATKIFGVVEHMPLLEEVYLDVPLANDISTVGTKSGSRWGIGGTSPNLRKVTIIAPKLIDWYYACQLSSRYGKASEFYGDMSAASSAQGMFDKWVLDAASVKRIKETIKAWTSGSHPITLGVDSTLQNDPDVLADIQAIRDKRWTVTLQWNART